MKRYLLGFLLLAPGLTQAQTTYPYLVKGKIGQLNAPAKIYLLSGPQVLDSATLKNGQFEFKGSVEWLHSAALVVARQGNLGDAGRAYFQARDRSSFFLEPGPVVVTSPDSLTHAHITGGSQQAAYQRLQTALKPLYKRMRSSPSKTENDALTQEYSQTILAFIKANPSSWAGLEVLGQLKMIAPPVYSEVAPVYATLNPELKNSPPGRFYGNILEGLKATAIGAQAPDFTQNTPEGKPVSLSDYRGRYVLVDFRSSGCVSCRQENPTLTTAYNTFKARRFDIISVSLDREEAHDKWLKAIADDHLPWTQVSDQYGLLNKAALLYGVDSMPKNFLIDPTGKIVAANLHGDELQAKLAQLIK
ncbi:MAG: redoxin domain-containing protein [Janthinobacterium lividum]